MRSTAAPLLLTALLITSSACDPASPDPIALEVEPRSWRMTPGETTRVTVAGSSAPSDFTWLSSNEEVATVAPDGRITAVAPGSARITARSEGAEGSMEIAVLEAPTSCDASLNTRHGASMPDDATWRVADGPHLLAGQVTAKRLTIEAGALVCGDDGGILMVEERLTAAGAADAPIVFRAMPDLERPWRGVTLGSGEQGAVAELDHVTFQDARNGLSLMGDESRFTASNLSIRRGDQSGIAISVDGGDITISDCEVVESGGPGILVDSGNVRVEGCNLVGNVGPGVENLGSGEVDARGNWWGDPDGPNGPAGDGVSENVLYEPFLTAPRQAGGL